MAFADNRAVLRRLTPNLAPAPVYWGDALTSERLWPCAEIPAAVGRTLDLQARKAILAASRNVYAAARAAGTSGATPAGLAAREAALRVPLRPDWSYVNSPLLESLVCDKVGRNPALADALRYTSDREPVADGWSGPLFASPNRIFKNLPWHGLRKELRTSGPEALLQKAAKARAETERWRQIYIKENAPPRSTDPAALAALIGPGTLFQKGGQGLCTGCGDPARGAWCVVTYSRPTLNHPSYMNLYEVRHYADGLDGRLLPSEVKLLEDALEAGHTRNPGYEESWSF